MIPRLGSPLEIGLAVAVYMVALVLFTEYLKPVLQKVFNLKTEIKDGKALTLAWVVGLVIFWLLALAGCYAVTWTSGIIFVVVTGFCNTAYRWTRLKELLRLIHSGG